MPFSFTQLFAKLPRRSARREPIAVLHVSDEGVRMVVRIVNGRTWFPYSESTSSVEIEWRWSDVRRIVAFKRDIFAFDLICLGFELPDRAVEIAEDMDGWEDVVKRLPAQFPGLNSDWWNQVAFPPFATSPTAVWTRASGS